MSGIEGATTRPVIPPKVESEQKPIGHNLDGTPIYAQTSRPAQQDQQAQGSRFDLKQYGQSFNSVIANMRNEPTNAQHDNIRDAKNVTIYGTGTEPPISDKAEGGLHEKTLQAAKERVTFEFQQKYGQNYNLPDFQFAKAKVGDREVLLVSATANLKTPTVDESKNFLMRGVDRLVGGVTHAARSAGEQPVVTLAYDIDKGIPLGMQTGRNKDWEAAPLAYKNPISVSPAPVAAPVIGKATDGGSAEQSSKSSSQNFGLAGDPKQRKDVPQAEAGGAKPKSDGFPNEQTLKEEFVKNPSAFYEREIDPKTTKAQQALLKHARDAAIAQIVQMDSGSTEFKTIIKSLGTDDQSEIHAKQYLAAREKGQASSKPPAAPPAAAAVISTKKEPNKGSSDNANLKVVSDALDAKIKTMAAQVESKRGEAHRSDSSIEFAKLSQELAALKKLQAGLSSQAPESLVELLKFTEKTFKETSGSVKLPALVVAQNELKRLLGDTPNGQALQMDERIEVLNAQLDDLRRNNPNGGSAELQAKSAELAALMKERQSLGPTWNDAVTQFKAAGLNVENYTHEGKELIGIQVNNQADLGKFLSTPLAQKSLTTLLKVVMPDDIPVRLSMEYGRDQILHRLGREIKKSPQLDTVAPGSKKFSDEMIQALSEDQADAKLLKRAFEAGLNGKDIPAQK